MTLSSVEIDRQFFERGRILSEGLLKKKIELAIAWQNGGGWEGARTRLEFANNFLSNKEKRSE